MNSKTKSTVDSQPQRSEQQEWTLEYVNKLLDKVAPALAIARAHKAALAAAKKQGFKEGWHESCMMDLRSQRSEQQEWTVQTEAGDNNVGIYPKYGKRIAFIHSRIEAERIVAAHKAALAAEREKMKPLVKSLEYLRKRIKASHGMPNFGREDIQVIDAALAQCKEP
jgi:hypothetical protein